MRALWLWVCPCLCFLSHLLRGHLVVKGPCTPACFMSVYDGSAHAQIYYLCVWQCVSVCTKLCIISQLIECDGKYPDNIDPMCICASFRGHLSARACLQVCLFTCICLCRCGCVGLSQLPLGQCGADWQFYPWLSWWWWWMCFGLPRRPLFRQSICMHNIVLAWRDAVADRKIENRRYGNQK